MESKAIAVSGVWLLRQDGVRSSMCGMCGSVWEEETDKGENRMRRSGRRKIKKKRHMAQR